ncbi:choice-of-anchor J domain-containing protein [Kaistella sp. PBT33-4]|uniref:T9SS-dependent choice-of-anchor J family protein n=1 Tax=Kaistella sp. PBT33-4 TaxID=3032000 RepID=UPI0023D8487E|nr:choice-of-anchor J domain-containing protein [Kaistella sp. PBT33-4]MDF0719649.1 choice-of-anchor J domain-containing protein [Kaistella sp. PBT33-4]
MRKILLSAFLAAFSFASAQTTVYTYGFDTDFGTDWTRTNQSTAPPATPTLWSKATYTTASTVTNSIFGSGIGGVPSGQAGGQNSFALVNYTSTNTGTISNWLISPTVNVQDGDVVTFYTRKGTDGTVDYADRLEVRYSSAATTVVPGTGPTDVGSFTNLGVSVNPNQAVGFVYPQTWTQYTFNITGVGSTPVPVKFAFRYFVTNAGPSGSNSDIIGIDSFLISRSSMATGEVAAKKFSISPNPATDFIHVKNTDKLKSITVYDMSGRKVPATLNGELVDVRGLANGTYLIDIETDNGKVSQKFIKK